MQTVFQTQVSVHFSASTNCVKSHYHSHHSIFTLPVLPKFPFLSPPIVALSYPQPQGGCVLLLLPSLVLQLPSAGAPLLPSLAATFARVAAAPPQDSVAALLLSYVHKDQGITAKIMQD